MSTLLVYYYMPQMSPNQRRLQLNWGGIVDPVEIIITVLPSDIRRVQSYRWKSQRGTPVKVQVGETGWSTVAGNGRLRQTVCMGVIDICCLQYLSVTAIYFMHKYLVSRCLQDCQFNKNMLCINNLIKTCFVFYRYFEEHFSSTLHSWDGGGWGCVCFLLAGFRHRVH